VKLKRINRRRILNDSKRRLLVIMHFLQQKDIKKK
jgi:hypothetical protein